MNLAAGRIYICRRADAGCEGRLSFIPLLPAPARGDAAAAEGPNIFLELVGPFSQAVLSKQIVQFLVRSECRNS